MCTSVLYFAANTRRNTVGRKSSAKRKPVVCENPVESPLVEVEEAVSETGTVLFL